MHLVILVAAFGIIGATGTMGNDAARLHKDLVSNESYQKNVIPVYNSSTAVAVKFHMTLQEIISLEEGENRMTTHVWLSYEWTNIRLRWSPDKYGDEKSLRMSPNDMWTPDIELYNRAVYDDFAMERHLVVVYSNGVCSMVRPVVLTSSCSMDMKDYPYNRHTCLMKFGSWTHDGLSLDLTTENEVDVSSYVENDNWILEEASAIRNAVSYECCPEPYVDVTFKFTVHRRHPERIQRTMLLPVVIVFLLSLTSFLLPPVLSQKIISGIAAVISAVVLYFTLTMITPWRSIYECYSVFLVGLTVLSLLMETIITRIYHCDSVTKRMPNLVRTINNKVSVVVLLGKSDSSNQLSEDKNSMTSDVARSTTANDWQLMAHNLDRIFLLVYLIVAILGFLVIRFSY